MPTSQSRTRQTARAAINAGPSGRWSAPAWRGEVEAWVRRECARLGLETTGLLEEERIRPWSAVLRVPIRQGRLFFKATVPTLAHERDVIEVLARRRPDAITEVVASNRDRGWMLMRDAGASLDEMTDQSEALRHWEAALPQYAQLQIDVTEDAAELAGVFPLDRRTAVLPDLFEEAIDDTKLLGLGSPAGLTVAEHERLRRLAPDVRSSCAELAASPIRDTIQNDDFTSTAIFAARQGYRFLDWGDSCVAFPFFTLTITLRVIAHLYGLPAGAGVLMQLRDAYLEPWTCFASRAELDALDALARPLGQVCSAMLYCDDMRKGAWEQEPDAVPWSLRLVIEPEAWRDATD